ncbi:MAG: DUF3857 domain-containing protein [Acidobacteriota bacterium]
MLGTQGSIVRSLTLSALLLTSTSLATAADFPPITEAERQLTEVPFEPEAAAVVLDEVARLRFQHYPIEPNSQLDVRSRIKILTEAGKSAAEVVIPHNDVMRLGDFEGRTVLPDGRVIPLGDDDIFIERQSRSRHSYVTKVVFPAVEVGAILDYSLIFYWDTFLYLDPWLFHSDLPKLRSEITYVKPENLGVRAWGKQTGAEAVQSARNKGPRGAEITLWMENLPSLPDEPFGFPTADLASRFMVIPSSVMSSGVEFDLLASWESVCDLFEDNTYKGFTKANRAEKRLVREQIAGAASDREKAEALFRWVRDEIQDRPFPGIWPAAERAKDVLDSRQGNMTDQALLLARLLRAAKIDAQLVWAGHRGDGRVDPTVANPAWFRGSLVRTEIDGSSLFLDPSDPTLAFGAVSPGYEGSVMIACEADEPQVLTMKASAARTNHRHAGLDLELDADGRWIGQGTLEYTGQAAWMEIGTIAEEALVETWSDWLGEQFEGYDIRDTEVVEEVETRRFTVRFAMAQREDEVLGDEASWQPSAPFSASQPFALPPERRRGPVQLDYASMDEVEITVRWAEDWTLDAAPEPTQFTNDAGAIRTTFAVDADGRMAHYQRQFVRDHFEYLGSEAYGALRTLHETARTHDTQTLVWIHD